MVFAIVFEKFIRLIEVQLLLAHSVFLYSSQSRVMQVLWPIIVSSDTMNHFVECRPIPIKTNLKADWIYSTKWTMTQSYGWNLQWLQHSWTHTHTCLTALCPGLPRWAGTRKVKPVWILLKQETVSGGGISWAICKSAPRFRQITIPAPHHSVFAAVVK